MNAQPLTLCTSCHASVAHQLDNEVPHAPAAESDGCLTCHGPHSTRHPALLQESVVTTCLNCHDTEDSGFVQDHLGLPAAGMACESCHDPHASQMAGMLLPLVHEPFGAGDCMLCHEETEGGAP